MTLLAIEPKNLQARPFAPRASEGRDRRLVARVPIGQGDRIDVFSKCRTALEQGEIDAGASTVTGSDDRSGSFLATAVGIPAFDVDGSATRGTGHVGLEEQRRSRGNHASEHRGH